MSNLTKRLDAHFAACAAAAASAAVAGIGEKAGAAIVYSGVVNIPIPGNFLGVYIDLVTGVTGTSQATVPGFDLNPYYGGNSIFAQNNAAAVGIKASAGPPTGQVINLALGAPVIGPFFTGNPLLTSANFVPGTPGLVGVSFRRESDNAVLKGWVRMSRGANNTTAGLIVDYAYENTGASILAGDNGTNTCQFPLPHANCAADVDNNGSVNVNDLLAVITHWGETGPPGRPIADVAPPPNGDCAVNVNDLLAVITTWGICSAPVGGCCATNGSCSVITQSACDAIGGTYQGNGAPCPGNCPVVPPNDNPCGALTLNVSVSPAAPAVNNGNNTGATNGTVPQPSCGSNQLTRDVWYKYTVPTIAGVTGQILNLDLCTTTGPFTDTVMVVYNAATCTSAFAEIACNDDACASLSRAQTSLLPPGTNILIRVASFGIGGTNQGAFVLQASAINVTNDVCAGAVALTFVNGVATATGNLSSASQDNGPNCQGVSAGYGRWYSFTGTGSTITISTCSSISDIYDGAIMVFCAGASACNALNCYGATNADYGLRHHDVCPAFQGERMCISTVTTPGVHYYVLVEAAGTGLPTGIQGEYTLTLTTGACTPQNVTGVDCFAGSPPLYDECATALTVNAGSTPFTNAVATPASGVGSICGQPWSKDVWFRYTSNGGPVSVTVTSNPVWDSMIEIYNGAGCAPLGAIVGCVDDDPSCAGCHGTVGFTATAGTTYTIRVCSWSTSGGSAGNLVITDP